MGDALDHAFEVARRRAREFGISLRHLESSTMVGAYPYRPLNLVEFCLHEAAHLVTLGHHPREFPKLRQHYQKSLTDVVTDRFELMSSEAADQLEIDTARVTFVAGKALGLWDDPSAIIDSTRRNLCLLSRWGDQQTRAVEAAFMCLTQKAWSGQVMCMRQAALVEGWFRGRPVKGSRPRLGGR